MTWVMFESPATGNDRLVLLMVADEADDDGANAFPGIDRIALKARVSRATAIRSIGRLEAAGELLVKRPETHGRGRHNRYVVVLGRDPLELAARHGWPAPNLDPAVAAEWSQNDTLVVPADSDIDRDPQPGDKSVDDGAGDGGKGPDRSHDGPEKVSPGATRPHDPVTRARSAEPPGDHRPAARPFRRGLDRPEHVLAAEELVAAQAANAVDLDAWVAAREDGVEADPDARRAVLARIRAERGAAAEG